MPSSQTRRSFVATGAAAVSTGLLRAEGIPVRLGGPIFLKSDDPGELAKEHRRLGYSAAYCPEANAADRARISAIRKAFAENAVIHRWTETDPHIEVFGDTAIVTG